MDFNRGIARIAVVGFALVNVFAHIKEGFGIFNVRITGIVIVATLICILAVVNPAIESASIGILGAIAGYLFGYGVKEWCLAYNNTLNTVRLIVNSHTAFTEFKGL